MLEALHEVWFPLAELTKNRDFADTLEVAVAKIKEYYDKTELSDVYIVMMCMSLYLLNFKVNSSSRQARHTGDWCEQL